MTEPNTHFSRRDMEIWEQAVKAERAELRAKVEALPYTYVAGRRVLFFIDVLDVFDGSSDGQG
jgi:hypothetical protein